MLELVSRAVEAQGEGMRLQMEASDLVQKGDLAPAADRFARSIVKQREALELNRELNAKVWATPSPLEPVAQPLINGLFMYADTLDALREPDRADVLRNNAVECATQYLSDAGVAEAQRSTAASLIARGRFPEALVALYKARDRIIAGGMALKGARITMDLADIFQWLGDYDRALELVEEAAKIGEDAPLRDGIHAFEDIVEKERLRKEHAFYRGLIARRCGRYDEAEANLREALVLYASTGPGLIAVEYQWAMLLVKQGKGTEALAALEQLEPQMRGAGLLRPKLAAFLRAKAEALLAQGRIDDARDAIKEALSDGEKYLDPDVRWTVQLEHAEVMRRLDRPADALAAYRAAAETVAGLRRAPLGFRLDNAYLTDKLPLFRAAVDLCVELDRPLECASFMEQIKARSLSAVLGATRSPSSAEPEASQEFDAVTRRLDALEYTSYSQDWTTERFAEHSDLLGRRAEILERLRFSDPRWRSLSTPLDLNLDAVISEVRRRDLAVMTMFFDRGSVTTVLLTADDQIVRRRLLDAAVAEALNTYIRNLTASDPQHELNDFSAGLAVRAEDLVSRELWAKAISRSRIILVPHRGLHLVPWASLSFSGKRLFEYKPVGVVPNLSCIVDLRFDPVAAPRISLVGPPDYSKYPKLRKLAGAAQEIKELKNLYKKSDRILAGPFVADDATDAVLLAELASKDRQGGILHVCCHASPDPEEPMNAGLLLGDGKVDAAEIARVRTAFDEVVLSACSTGWRPTQVANVELIADDCLGIPGAFLEAGARNVLVSIPEADDEATKAFMIRYHTSRSSGANPLDAYRNAQLEMLRDKQFSPETWVGLTMYGC
jgi:CHAT domain-containing protein